MSRVETKEKPAPRETEKGRRQPADHKGDEKTVEEALKRQERQGRA